MSCLRVVAVLGLISLATAAAPLAGQATLSVRGSGCETCQEVVDTLEDYLTDPQTQSEVAGFIDANVCAALPASVEQMCSEEVPQLVAAGASAIRDALVPADLCTVLGVCAASARTSPLAQLLSAAPGAALAGAAPAGGAALDGPLDCPVCKMIIVTMVQRLEDPTSRRQIEEGAAEACDHLLVQEEKAKCHADVSALFTALDNLLKDVDPEAACELLQFCTPDGPSPAPARQGAAAVAAVKAALRDAFAALAATPRAGQGAGRVGSSSSDESCDSCKQIVAEAAALLQDPKTQAELMAYAKEGCSVLQDFKDQCEAYVTLYGPLVFNMLLSYLQPEPVCTRLGYCSPAALAA